MDIGGKRTCVEPSQPSGLAASIRRVFPAPNFELFNQMASLLMLSVDCSGVDLMFLCSKYYTPSGIFFPRRVPGPAHVFRPLLFMYISPIGCLHAPRAGKINPFSRRCKLPKKRFVSPTCMIGLGRRGRPWAGAGRDSPQRHRIRRHRVGPHRREGTKNG